MRARCFGSNGKGNECRCGRVAKSRSGDVWLAVLKMSVRMKSWSEECDGGTERRGDPFENELFSRGWLFSPRSSVTRFWVERAGACHETFASKSQAQVGEKGPNMPTARSRTSFHPFMLPPFLRSISTVLQVKWLVPGIMSITRSKHSPKARQEKKKRALL